MRRARFGPLRIGLATALARLQGGVLGRAAAMTQGTIYNYVRSKDDILYLVCDRIVAEYQEQTREALETTADPAAHIRSAVQAVCEVMY